MNDSEAVFNKAYDWIISKNSKNGYLKYYINEKKAAKHKLMQE